MILMYSYGTLFVSADRFKISLKFVPKGPINKYPNIGSDNGLAPARRQTIVWTNAG